MPGRRHVGVWRSKDYIACHLITKASIWCVEKVMEHVEQWKVRYVNFEALLMLDQIDHDLWSDDDLSMWQRSDRRF